MLEGAQSLYREGDDDPKEKMWFVFETALVLPEYLVEIEYIKS